MKLCLSFLILILIVGICAGLWSSLKKARVYWSMDSQGMYVPFKISWQIGVFPRKPRSINRVDIDWVIHSWFRGMKANNFVFNDRNLRDREVTVSRIDHLMALKASICFFFCLCLVISEAKVVWLAVAFAAAKFSNHSSRRSDPLCGFMNFCISKMHPRVLF